MAKTVRCNSGHFYDPERHNSCPHCAVPGLDFRTDRTMPVEERGRTRAVSPGAARTPTADVRGRAGADDGLTVGYFENKLGMKPVVGWFVCVEGNDRGRDFRIVPERNSIGRGANMDISIASDRAISRDVHAFITYDPRNQEFVMAPGVSSGLTYINGSAMHAPTRLNPFDRVMVGETTLVFVPFCGEQFRWDVQA